MDSLWILLVAFFNISAKCHNLQNEPFFFPMLKLSLLFSLLISSSFSFSQIPVGNTIKPGVVLMKNATGEPSNIKRENKKNGVIVVFSCNTCPFVVGSSHFPGWENQYNNLFSIAHENEIGFVLINSNEAKRNGDDSFDKMVKHAKEQNYSMPYLLDEKSSLANFLKAKTTPHVFFFDSSFRLIYTGSIDNIWDGKRKKDLPFLKNAIASHLKNKKIKPKETSPKGCSIKRAKKQSNQ